MQKKIIEEIIELHFKAHLYDTRLEWVDVIINCDQLFNICPLLIKH